MQSFTQKWGTKGWWSAEVGTMQENNAGGSNSLCRLWMEAGNTGCRWVEAYREEQAVLWCHSIQRSSQAVAGRVTKLLVS